MCSLTGEQSSSSRYVWDRRVVARPLHPGIHIDGLKLPPSPVPVYILPPVSTNHVSSVSGSLLLIAHPAPAGGGECVLASLAAVSWCPGSSLLTCQYPLQQKVFSNGLHTPHHHRHWIHSATRSPVPLSCSQAELERVISRGSRPQSSERRVWLIRLHLRRWELWAAAACECLFCEIFLVVSSLLSRDLPFRMRRPGSRGYNGGILLELNHSKYVTIVLSRRRLGI